MIKYRKLRKYKYQVMETTQIVLPYNFKVQIEMAWVTLRNDVLTIKKAYCCDGATCFPDFKWIMLPSVVHDALCQLIRVGLLDEKNKVHADRVLRDLCRERLKKGMKKMADAVFFSVQKFGKFFMRKGKKQDKIYIAK